MNILADLQVEHEGSLLTMSSKHPYTNSIVKMSIGDTLPIY